MEGSLLDIITNDKTMPSLGEFLVNGAANFSNVMQVYEGSPNSNAIIQKHVNKIASKDSPQKKTNKKTKNKKYSIIILRITINSSLL